MTANVNCRAPARKSEAGFQLLLTQFAELGDSGGIYVGLAADFCWKTLLDNALSSGDCRCLSNCISGNCFFGL
jgi:hypothetical protein